MNNKYDVDSAGQELTFDDHDVPFQRLTDTNGNPWPSTTAFTRNL